ncbi:aminotransferase class V-fold PLP-dependent enzyme [Hoeflea sp. TYP-13]|uniref:aminotransferase class V-fold PLP-dependent enzyme n=1 Tax=Hoeflea sp. TYP-13 TaxID=3230023 RepID=UPI0034C5F573
MLKSASKVDPDGLVEFSVVFTDRSLNHMSQRFQNVMRDISSNLKSVYSADHLALVPGGGTFAMESVARQFAQDADVVTIRNGWFSFRWTQILDAGKFNRSHTVLKARQTAQEPKAPFRPVPVEESVETIRTQKPGIVFVPHVETSSGILMPDDYIKEISAAAHSVGALLVLDCIASGCIWVDMKALGVDVLISAPQKGWSSSPCAGIVMMNQDAFARLETTESDSFAANLKTWSNIMTAYENGGHAYHATMPTDALAAFRDVILECSEVGFEKLKGAQFELGKRVRDMLKQRGLVSVAADGYEAPGVVVCYADDASVQNGSAFVQNGVQIAAGVPLRCDEPEGFSTFRLGLFGLDKLGDIEGTVATLSTALDRVGLR